MPDRLLWQARTELSDAGDTGKLVDLVIVPDGRTATLRNGWFLLDAKAWAHVEGRFNAKGIHIPVDYEHQTLGGSYAREDGLSPAAGWIHKLRYEPGVGIIASVEWNNKAREMINAKEYKYPSASFLTNKRTGRVTEILSVAITNTPATPDIAPLAASSRFKQKGTAMGKPKKNTKKGAGKVNTLDLLGDGVRKVLQEADITPEEEAAVVEEVVEEIDEVGAAIAELKAMLELDDDVTPADVVRAAIEKLGSSDEDGEEGGATVKELKALSVALTGKRDSTVKTMIARADDLQAKTVSGEEYKALKDQLDELKSESAERNATSLVDKYVEEGRLNPHEEKRMEWAQTKAADDPDGFTSLMDGAPKIYDPTRKVDPQEGKGGKSERQRSIDEQVQSFKENVDKGCFGDSSMASVVNAGLQMKDEPGLTASERKTVLALEV